MLKHFFCSIIISKSYFFSFFTFHQFYFTNRDRILAALSKIDSSNDNNHAYIQLIKNLSLPLNRLEKYAILLKEYLHNLEVKLS
jgi:hypothetical protein